MACCLRIKESRRRGLPAVNICKHRVNDVAAQVQKEYICRSASYYSKILEMNPNDIEALIARSNCHLVLGNLEKAIEDAELILNLSNEDLQKARAIYLKAESLFQLGNFEMSLVFFYRGKKIRPELEQFRLGIQKSISAIESILRGDDQETNHALVASVKSKGTSNKEKKSRKAPDDRKEDLGLVRKLNVEKSYMRSLLGRPDIVNRNNSVTQHWNPCLETCISYIESRQDFWRQQQTSSSAKSISIRKHSKC